MRVLAVTHSAVVALLALVVGIPLGLALGRLVWAPIAPACERHRRSGQPVDGHGMDGTDPWCSAAWSSPFPSSRGSMRRQPAGDPRPD